MSPGVAIFLSYKRKYFDIMLLGRWGLETARQKIQNFSLWKVVESASFLCTLLENLAELTTDVLPRVYHYLSDMHSPPALPSCSPTESAEACRTQKRMENPGHGPIRAAGAGIRRANERFRKEMLSWQWQHFMLYLCLARCYRFRI